MGKPCDMEHDFQFSSLGLGACYTFNGFSKMPPLETSGAGTHLGLLMLLNISQSEYTASMFLDAGARVFIHRSSEPARILDLELSVPPGRAAFIGLSEETVVNEAGVDCVTNHDKFNFLANNFSYSVSACLVDCQLTAVADICDCYHFSSDLRPSNLSYADLRNCTFSDVCCIHEVLFSALDCNCPSACTSTFYEFSTTYSSFPADYGNDYFEFSIDDYKNVIEILVYFQTDFVKTETITFSYHVVDLLADIGGLVGLLLGISVVTFFEFCMWLLDEGIDRLCCFRISWKKKREKEKKERDQYGEVEKELRNSVVLDEVENVQCT